MGKKKILNDPIYGFISFPFDITYELMDHPWFQRLRRIAQMGLSHYVYPGAIHTRFHHALGALHLMTKAIVSLQDKGVQISGEEAKALSIAILLHDIGHGPFSHALEHVLLDARHEALSLTMMELLNEDYGEELAMAIEIFTGRYPKKFLHELVSSQLDMDRMDYLNRDSFYTGVAEGVIGYDRLIKMLNVHDNRLVVEEKGIYSVEKFIMARRLMYWQVYLHKTSVATEQMLQLFVHRLLELIPGEGERCIDPILHSLLLVRGKAIDRSVIHLFCAVDDVNILMALKRARSAQDDLLRYLAQCLLDRRLFKIRMENEPITQELKDEIVAKVKMNLPFSGEIAEKLIIEGRQSNVAYQNADDEIHILMKDGRCLPYSMVSDYAAHRGTTEKYFICFPNVEGANV